MNREERRKFDKKLQKAGFSKEQRENISKRLEIQSKGLTSNPLTCWEGEKVRLDYDRINSYPDYERLSPKYREFVESNKNTVFTVEFDPHKKEAGIKNMDSMVQLKEDPSKPKWLFWAGDLIPEGKQNRPVIENEKEKRMKEIENLIEQIKGD